MPTNFQTDLEARLHDGTVITASGDGSDTLDVGDAHLAPGTVVRFTVTALTTVDETYFGEVHASKDDGSNYIQVGSVEITSIGQWVAAFENQQDNEDYADLKVVFTVAGSNPSITTLADLTGPTH